MNTLARYLAGFIIVSSCDAIASTPVKMTDAMLQLKQEQISRAKFNMAYDKEQSDGQYDMVVFYQPSYFNKYGEYEGHQRIMDSISATNGRYAEQGIELQINVIDIREAASVPNDVPYLDPIGWEGQSGFQDFANSIFSNAALNPGNPEYDFFNYVGADGLVYFRERRSGDGSFTGFASKIFGYINILDSGSDRFESTTLDHELGHNLGAGHEIEDRVNDNHADGHAIQCGDRFTVMYSSASQLERIGKYSSPDLEDFGNVCGNESSANNLRVVKETAAQAVNWGAGMDIDGTVSLSESSYFVSEQSDLEVVLTRTGSFENEAQVKVFAINDSAVWGEDFFTAAVTAEFAAGQSSTSVTIDIANDNLDEQDEHFNLQLKYPVNLAIEGSGNATVSVINTENTLSTGTFSIDAESVMEGDSIPVTITREGSSSGEVLVKLTSSDMSTTNGLDYAEFTRWIVFKDGQDSYSINLSTIDDIAVETTEALSLTLTSDHGSVSATSSQTVEILDNDSLTAGILNLSGASNPSGQSITIEEGSTWTFIVERTQGFLNDVKGEIVLTYSNDQSATRTQFIIADGIGIVEVAVTLADNTIDEANYNAQVSIEVLSGGAEVSDSAVVININDNDSPSSSDGELSDASSAGGAISLVTILLVLMGFWRRRICAFVPVENAISTGLNKNQENNNAL